ncbi:TrmH family RNA methyltransferase [Leptospira ilyithenensis]|uniref:RNA methyltransferase n=1 Tax=Leptospira ilyithenensis TaxID=2484901 RepID=A0A4R9LVB5_9LEPT|nr:RNA methyltransferase [Leptospira ilyithenensis]TGN16758.1 RNA methyltransferase [Leptospira ilyithenensis]
MKPQVQSITSFSNPKVKWVSSLKEKRSRDEEKKFFIEGYREIFKAIKGGSDSSVPTLPVRLHSLFISPDCFLGENESKLIGSVTCPIFELPKKIFEKISYRDRPDGLIAVAETPNANYDWDLFPALNLNPVLIIEGVEKPGNLGTILRTAEGAGVGLVLVTDPRIDLFNPNVIRASTGTLFTLPTYISSLSETIVNLRKQNYSIHAVTPEGKSLYSNTDFRKKSAFLFGSEQYGLTPSAKEESDDTLYLPMFGEADSLNLAMSCGIVLYESLRQRNTGS